jgi:hypothetical protein
MAWLLDWFKGPRQKAATCFEKGRQALEENDFDLAISWFNACIRHEAELMFVTNHRCNDAHFEALMGRPFGNSAECLPIQRGSASVFTQKMLPCLPSATMGRRRMETHRP